MVNVTGHSVISKVELLVSGTIQMATAPDQRRQMNRTPPTVSDFLITGKTRVPTADMQAVTTANSDAPDRLPYLPAKRG